MTTSVPVPTGPLKAIITAQTATPTIAQNPHVDIGTALASLFHNLEPAAESLANFGLKTALAAVPFGTVIVGYAVPLVDQYVQSAFTTLGPVLEAANLPVPAGNTIFAAAAKMFNDNEASLANFLGGALNTLLHGAVAKLGLPISALDAVSAPATPVPGKYLGIP